MATRRQQRKAKEARLRELQTPPKKLPAPKESTPPEWKQADPEPWMLADFGLHKEPFVGSVPRWQAGPIIKVWGSVSRPGKLEP